MIWLTWRQYRIEILILTLSLLLVASILLITGTNIASFAHHIGNTNCSSQKCIVALNMLTSYIYSRAFDNSAFYYTFQYALLALPPLVGMFIGTQTVGRELEQGTYRLIWTQSISWSRWLLIKTGGLICLTLCASTILYCLLIWWKGPVITSLNSVWNYMNFDIWSLAAVAYTLFALSLGVCTGTIVRRTVPAMAITLVIFITLRILISIFWRPYFLPPMVLLVPLNSVQEPPQQSLVMSSYEVDRQGNRLTVDPCQVDLPPSGSLENNSSSRLQLNMVLPLMNVTLPLTITHSLSGGPTSPQALAQEKAYEQCVTKHGFQIRYLYQPPDRFWLFQEIECAIYVVLSMFLLALTLWWTKYRIIGRSR